MTFPHPTHVQIQTTAACGAACAICPHPAESPKWSNGLMSDELFDRVAGELAGRPVEYLCPYLMADPLSDKKIFGRMAALRRALPGAHMELSTTGLYLVPRLAERLLEAPLDELRLSSHGISEAEWRHTMPGVPWKRAWPNLLRFIELWQARRPYALKVVTLWGLWPAQREAEIEAFWSDLGVEMVRWQVISRAQQVDLRVLGAPAAAERRPAPESPSRCRFDRDRRWLHVLSDGRVTLCCMDYRHEAILGDLSTHSLDEVWHGPAFEHHRAAIRGDVPTGEDFLCRRCEWWETAGTSKHRHVETASTRI